MQRLPLIPPPDPPGLIGSLFSLLQFLASPVTGALSDRHGRRPLLILTTVSELTSVTSCGVTPLCPRWESRAPVQVLLSANVGIVCLQLGLMSSYAVWAVSRSFSMFLLFRVIGGICKGNVSLCTAIVADLPCPKARNRGMVGHDLFKSPFSPRNDLIFNFRIFQTISRYFFVPRGEPCGLYRGAAFP